jgi:uncharacterized lipoprotein YehR (DUF1307 family)
MKVKMVDRIVLALFLAVFITSCGTTKLTKDDQANVDAGNKAIVKTYNQPLIGAMIFDEQPVTQILSVNGKKVAGEILKLDEQIAVDIGVHKVEFSCSDRSGHNEKDYIEIIQLEFKPHHEYLVRCSFDSGFGPNGSYEGSFSIKEKRLK